MQFSPSTLRGIFAWLLFLCMSTVIPASSAEIVICDRSKVKKLCMKITPLSQSSSVWLWITSSCNDDCVEYDDDFVARYLFVEELPDKQFGMELFPTVQGEMYLASCSIDKTQPSMPATISFPVTKSETLIEPNNATGLLKDLVRINPDRKELIRRHQQIPGESTWVKSILTHFAAALITLILFNCCCHSGW